VQLSLTAGATLETAPSVLASQRMAESPHRTGIRSAASLVAPRALFPSSINFSQSSVNGVDEIARSMRANGWVGDPIDVVRPPDGSLATIDNTRVLAAHQAGIDVQTTIRAL